MKSSTDEALKLILKFFKPFFFISFRKSFRGFFMKLSDVKTISVIGAGTMGHEIAQVCLMAEYPNVILNDVKEDVLTKARHKIESGLKKLEQKKKLSPGQTAENLMQHLETMLDFKAAVEGADFIIEAVPEVMTLKKEVFAQLGSQSPPHAILATNTSTMPITEIAKSSNRREKVVGMHFFTPIVVLRLIEVIKGQHTSEETMRITTELGQSLPALKGKKYIARIEKETPGSIVNRLTGASSAYINWLVDVAEEKGIPFEHIDADVADFGLGPCAKWDYLGLDTIYNALSYLADTLSKDFAPGNALTTLVEEEKLGKKTGQGFCSWTEDGQLKSNTDEKAGLFDMELFMALQLNEGCRLLEDGVVSGYKVIDDTMLACMDMPGPFGAGKRNYERWSDLLNQFAEDSGKEYFRPCELMKSGKFRKMRR